MKRNLKNGFAALLMMLSVSSVVALPAMVSADSACEGAQSIQHPNETQAQIKARCANNADAKAELSSGLTGIIKTIIDILLFLIGAIAVIMLIVGGIKYVVSGGDQGATTSAKNTILYAVIGLVVAIMAYAIVNFVLNSLI